METENYPNTAPLHFLPYITWNQRGEAPKSPGIYVISKATPENLIYVGLTQQTDGLRGRLRQFHRSATTGMHNHAGGVTYHRLFGAEVSDLIFTIRRVEDVIAPSRALREALTELIAHTDSHKGNPAELARGIVSFLGAVSSGFSPTAFGNRFVNEAQTGCTSKCTGKPLLLQSMARHVVDAPNHRGVAKALERLRELVTLEATFSQVRIHHFREFAEAIQLGQYENADDGFAENS